MGQYEIWLNNNVVETLLLYGIYTTICNINDTVLKKKNPTIWNIDYYTFDTCNIYRYVDFNKWTKAKTTELTPLHFVVNQIGFKDKLRKLYTLKTCFIKHFKPHQH